jgi:autophagy-related protein 18
MIATASNKGTVIRVFPILDDKKFYQFRRGTYPAAVYCIGFR